LALLHAGGEGYKKEAKFAILKAGGEGYKEREVGSTY
jgi:hypothetical protein